MYYRGKMKDTNIINLPEYWEDLIDIDTISVNLTPMGTFQELFVKKIEWGKRIIVMNNVVVLSIVITPCLTGERTSNHSLLSMKVRV